jgi:hypothetical protein
MSLIVGAVRRIATVAEQRKFPNLPGDIISSHDPYPPFKRVMPTELTQEQTELVNENFDNYQPRLTLEQIEEIVEPYQFRLPQEVYDLYELGNGCLPIGTSEEDWNSVYNYFNFPGFENPFWTLRGAISAYCDRLIHQNSRLLPICAYEDESVLLVLGSNESQESAPLLLSEGHRLDDDPLEMEIIWPSLSNMMLAYAERYEALLDGSLTDVTKEEIYRKYSSGSDWGLYKFIH